MLRPWDNVPRKALSQEITANRVVYGNYLQNYNLISKVKKLSFLKKESLNKLLDFEMEKVCRLLNEYKRPYRTIILNKCAEFEIGYLMMNFMLETIILAYLNNLNPVDQPAIDKGKSIKLK